MKNRKVFTAGSESELINYLLKTLNIYFALSPKEQRKLTYEVGEANKLNKIGHPINFFDE